MILFIKTESGELELFDLLPKLSGQDRKAVKEAANESWIKTLSDL